MRCIFIGLVLFFSVNVTAETKDDPVVPHNVSKDSVEIDHSKSIFLFEQRPLVYRGKFTEASHGITSTEIYYSSDYKEAWLQRPTKLLKIYWNETLIQTFEWKDWKYRDLEAP